MFKTDEGKGSLPTISETAQSQRYNQKTNQQNGSETKGQGENLLKMIRNITHFGIEVDADPP